MAEATVELNGEVFERRTVRDRTYWVLIPRHEGAGPIHFDNTDDTARGWRLLATALDRIVEVK